MVAKLKRMNLNLTSGVTCSRGRKKENNPRHYLLSQCTTLRRYLQNSDRWSLILTNQSTDGPVTHSLNCVGSAGAEMQNLTTN